MNTVSRIRWGLFLLVLFIAPVTVLARSQPPDAARTLTGRLAVVHGDPMPGTPGGPIFQYYLTDDQGETHRFVLSSTPQTTEAEMLAWNGSRVTLTISADGRLLSRPELIPVRLPKNSTLRDNWQTGNQPWVTLACRYSDLLDEPVTVDFLRDMVGDVKPGLNHYWQEVSYGRMDLDGSVALGWYTLPHPRDYYKRDGIAHTDELYADCVAAADPDVYFPDFSGINMIFNYGLLGYSYGNWTVDTLDGVEKRWGQTWILGAYHDVSITAHEMGHALGLNHSLISTGEAYKSAWDVMSMDRYNCAAGSPYVDPVHGCMPQNTLAINLDELDWIPDEQHVTVQWPGEYTFTLERTSRPQTNNPLLVTIYDTYNLNVPAFTVEARQRVGYDKKLPGDAVIIHERNYYHTTLVDIDDPLVTYDEGAMWRVGETFDDPQSDLTISVDAKTATGFKITVNAPDWFEPNDTKSDAWPLDEPSYDVGPKRILAAIEQPGDVDLFRFPVYDTNYGLRIGVNVTSIESPLDPVLTLYKEYQGELYEVRQNDDYGGGLDANIMFNQPTQGIYYLEVRSANPDQGGDGYNYELYITPEIDSHELNDSWWDATPLAYGAKIEGATIGVPGDQDMYAFRGNAGDEITVDIDAETIGSRMDPVLYLYNDAQDLLAEMDDEDYYLDPNLTFTLPETGRYFLMVREFEHGVKGDDRYDYDLSLTAIDGNEPNDEIDTATRIAYGDIVTDGLIGAADDLDYYAFTGKAGDVVRAEVTAHASSHPLNAKLSLQVRINGDVEELAENDDYVMGVEDPRLLYVLPLNGTYYLEVSPSYYADPDGKRATYQLGLFKESDPNELNDHFFHATPLAYGDVIDNAVIGSPGDEDFYRFEGHEGDEIIVDIDAEVNGSMLDSTVALYSDEALYVDEVPPLAENDDEEMYSVDSYLTYTLPYDGEYYVRVRAFGHGLAGSSDHTYEIALALADGNEPNDEVAEATDVALGDTVRFASIGEQADQDYYRFQGEAGQMVRALVDAADSGSPLDAELILYRKQGATLVPLAESDDQSFFTTDPQLVYELPADDVYYVLVRSSKPNEGGARYFYNLSLAEETDPNELNDTFAQATDLEYGSTVDQATIGVPGDLDFYHFSGKAGDPVAIVVESLSRSAGLDAKLTLMDSNYNDLAVSDDPDSADARLFYTLPDDGDYLLLVVDADHGHAGGPEYAYRLRLTKSWLLMMPAVMRGEDE